MASDVRFDAFLRDLDDAGNVIEELPLILREGDGGGIAFSMSAVSPFAGQLSPGDRQDSDLSRWTVKTQRDWRGGLGQDQAYEPTDAFIKGIADTRFRNSVMLPPMPVQTTISAPTDPAFQAGGSTVNGVQSISASWVPRTPVNQSASASWSTASRAATQAQAEARWTYGADSWKGMTNGTPGSPSTYQVSGTGRGRATRFTVSQPMRVTTLLVNIAAVDNGAGGQFSIGLYTDSAGLPGSLIASGTGNVSSPHSGAVSVTITDTILNTGTNYWIVYFNVTATSVYLWTTVTSLSGAVHNGTSWSGGQTPIYFDLFGAYLTSSRIDLGQRFLSPSNFSMTTARIRVSRSTWASGSQMTLSLFTAGTATAPGTVIQGTSITADPGVSETEVVFNITASLTAGTYYWWVLTIQTAIGFTTIVYWHGDSNQGYKPAGSSQPAYQSTDGNGLVWSSISKCLYFKVGLGYADGAAFFTTHALTRTRIESTFTPTATVAMTQMKVYIDRTVWSGNPTMRLRILNNVGTQIATATAADPGASTAWVQFTMSASLTNAQVHTLILEIDAPTTSDSATVRMYGDNSATCTLKAFSSEAFTWSSSSTPSLRPFVLVNSSTNYPVSGAYYYFTHTGSETRRAQSFTTGAGVTVTQLRLFLRRLVWTGSPTVTVAIYSNSGGLPNTLLDSVALTSAAFDAANAVTSAAWVPVTISEVLSPTTTYWIVIQPDAPTTADTVSIEWSGDTAAGYAGSFASSTATDGFAYGAFGATAGFDAYFMVNFGSPLLASVTVPPHRFKDKWYCASGVTIYRWNTSTSVWDTVATGAAAVTSLSSIAGKIYAALGDSNDMIESSTGDSASWTATAGARRYTYLREFGGFMYLAKADGGANSLAYTNGTLWETALTVGDSLTKITGLVPFQNELLILSTRKIFSLSSDRIYQTYIYEQEEAADNGRNAAQWIVDGLVYVPVRNGLQAYDGMRMKDVGPDRGEGLPIGEQGRIAALAGTKTWLFAAIDAGTAGTSGVYAYNGREGGGWHCLVRATAPGRRIRALGLEAITSAAGSARLWFFEEATPYYIELPDLTDNPFQYAGARFASTGELTASKIGGELAQIPKDFQSIGVRADDCTATRTVEVWYEVDGAAIWRRAGIVTQSPYQEIALGAGTMSNKEIGSGSTTTVINIVAPGSTSDIEVGSFVRINNEVRQVSAVNSPTQFTLAIALPAAPVAGDDVYASRPAGREIRYRLVLTTSDSTKTPRVQRVSIRWQELILQYWRFSMTVRVDDIQTDRRNQPYPYTSAELRRRLKLWVKRLTPFYLDAPDGTRYRVKVMGGNDGNWVRKTNGIDSVVSINLDEV